MTLKLADNLKLPDALLAQHMAVLGKTRSGKSSVLRLFVESLLDRKERVCVIDPKGDWHGLRASADGKHAGYGVVIFGGTKADLPLNQHAGHSVAELVATGNRPCVIDLGGWMVGERTRFFIDFASTLFRTIDAPLYLIIDEVHNFAPQGKVLDPDAGKMLHWANRLGSEGAGKGLVILSASQRPQKVHKDFLTCAETLIAMRVIHKLDRDAIKDWIDGAGDPTMGKEVLSTLGSMQRGEGWVWSPEAKFGPERVRFPLFKTYDSFAAPVAGKSKTPLKGWAEVNLDDVKAKLASVVQEAKANDPKELRREIADLKKQLAAKPATADDAGLKQELRQARAAVSQRDNIIDSLKTRMGKVAGGLTGKLVNDLHAYSSMLHVNGEATPKALAPIAAVPLASPKPRPQPARRVATGLSDARLGKCERAILQVLSQHPDGCAAGKLTLLAGYRYSGSFQNALGTLRTAGLIEGENRGTMTITADGESLGPFEPLPKGQTLRDYWLSHSSFGKCEREILRMLFESQSGLTADELCSATGYEYSGSFQNALGNLRTAGVLMGRNKETMRASDDLLEV